VGRKFTFNYVGAYGYVLVYRLNDCRSLCMIKIYGPDKFKYKIQSVELSEDDILCLLKEFNAWKVCLKNIKYLSHLT
jgi:hypothetical protein